MHCSSATRFIASFILVLLLMGCGQKWSQSEKDNAQHFIQSVRLVVQAHAIDNQGKPGIMSEDDFATISGLYKNALSEANRVMRGAGTPEMIADSSLVQTGCGGFV